MFAKGAILFHEGGPADRVVLIDEGWVRVTTDSASGYVSVLATRGPGELVGELAAIDGAARSATVSAIQDVRAVAVSAEKYRACLASHPDFAWNLLRQLVCRLRESDRRRAEYGGHTSVERVARVLHDMLRLRGVTVPGGIEVTVSHRELAGAASTSRESVVRALRALQEAGVVRTGRKSVLVLASDQLAGYSSVR
ncbi:Crp/Fnr family transcriptional regulator [Longispora urticae]